MVSFFIIEVMICAAGFDLCPDRVAHGTLQGFNMSNKRLHASANHIAPMAYFLLMFLATHYFYFFIHTMTVTHLFQK